jgi:hypothetical protein
MQVADERVQPGRRWFDHGNLKSEIKHLPIDPPNPVLCAETV